MTEDHTSRKYFSARGGASKVRARLASRDSSFQALLTINYDSCCRAEDAPWYFGNRVANELSSSSPPGLSSFEKGSTFLRSTQASRHARARTRLLWECAAAHAPVVYSVVVPGLLFAELGLLALRRWGASLAVCRHMVGSAKEDSAMLRSSEASSDL